MSKPTKHWSRKEKVDKIIHDELPTRTSKKSVPKKLPTCYEFERQFIENLTETDGQIVLKYGMVCTSHPEAVVKRASHFPRIFNQYGGTGNPEILARLLNEATENIPNFKGTFVQGIGISSAIQKKAQDYTDEIRKSLIEIERLLQIIPKEVQVIESPAPSTPPAPSVTTKDTITVFPKIKILKTIQFSAPNAIVISPNVTPDDVIKFNEFLKKEILTILQEIINASATKPITIEQKDKIIKTFDLFQSELFKFIDSEQIRVSFKESTQSIIESFDRQINNIIDILNQQISKISIDEFESIYSNFITKTSEYITTIKETRPKVESVNTLFKQIKDTVKSQPPTQSVVSKKDEVKGKINSILSDITGINQNVYNIKIGETKYNIDKLTYNSQTASAINSIQNIIKTQKDKITELTNEISSKLDAIKVPIIQKPDELLAIFETSSSQFLNITTAITEISKQLGELNDIFEKILQYKTYFRKLIEDIKEFQQKLKADLSKNQTIIDQIGYKITKIDKVNNSDELKQLIDTIEQIFLEYKPLIKGGSSKKRSIKQKRKHKK